MEITIYTTTSCPYCGMLKKFLAQRNVEFTEKRVDEDLNAREEMKQLSDGYLGVPFVIFKKGDEVHKIMGFNEAAFNDLIG